MKIIAISFGCSTTALLAHSSFILGSTNAELAHELEIAKEQTDPDYQQILERA